MRICLRRKPGPDAEGVITLFALNPTKLPVTHNSRPPRVCE